MPSHSSKEYNRQYQQKNKARLKAKRRAKAKTLTKAQRQRLSAQQMAWAKRNPDRAKCIRLQSYYGITLDQYNKMLRSQRGRCKICSDKMNPPHIDHCHASGRVRGLLCQFCNFMLGHARDSAKILKAGAIYLTNTTSKV